MKVVWNILVLIALLGLSSCSEKNKKKDIDTTIKINSFEFIEDYELNKSIFKEKEFKVDSYSNYNGKLMVSHSKEKNYIVLNFVLLGPDHNLYLTYWTDKKLKIKFSRSTAQYLNKENSFKENNQTYAEITNVNTFYLSYLDSSIKMHDHQKNEILDEVTISQQKKRTESFYYELIDPISMPIYYVANGL